MKLEDVARCSQVSTATVSRVLNTASSVRSATRARVVKAIEMLKYNSLLSSLDLRAHPTGPNRPADKPRGAAPK